MPSHFKRVGLIGKYSNPEIKGTLQSVLTLLIEQQIEVTVEKQCASLLLTDKKGPSFKISTAEDLAKDLDLVIVVGGDGSLLTAARAVVDFNVPVVGVNRGRLGFLTDVSPQSLTEDLTPILSGYFTEEQRFLLKCDVIRNNKSVEHCIALNDVVLYSGDIARLIEFEVFIDGHFVNRQRSDGLITATPTGSTAYALAGGGPIMHPELAAIVMVPMHPLTLSSRPIVVPPDVELELLITAQNQLKPRLSGDGQIHFTLEPSDKVQISRYNKTLRLIHPKSYDYYHTLRSKLGWSNER